jgi:hypothetical protein
MTATALLSSNVTDDEIIHGRDVGDILYLLQQRFEQAGMAMVEEIRIDIVAAARSRDDMLLRRETRC